MRILTISLPAAIVITLLNTGCGTTRTWARGNPNSAAALVNGSGQVVAGTAHVATAGACCATTAGNAGVDTAWTILSFPGEMLLHPFKTPFRTVGKLTNTSLTLAKSTVAVAGAVVTAPSVTTPATNLALVKTAAAAATPHATAARIAAPVLADVIVSAAR
jgi:hypothetical protein